MLWISLIMKLNLETALLKSNITQFPQRFLKLVLQNQLSLVVNRNFLVLKKKKNTKKANKTKQCISLLWREFKIKCYFMNVIPEWIWHASSFLSCCLAQVSFFLFIIFVVYTMLPFNMRDAIVASVLTSASHTIVLSVCLSGTAVIKEHLVWQVGALWN